MIVSESRSTYELPTEDPTPAILQIVSAATVSVHLIAFSLSLKPLVDLLIAKHAAGLDVQVVLDWSQSVQRFERPSVMRLQAAGVPTVIGSSPVAGQIIHVKLILVDGKTSIRGSANWTHAGLSQEVNLVDVETAPGMLTALEAFFQRVQADARAHPQMRGPSLWDQVRQKFSLA